MSDGQSSFRHYSGLGETCGKMVASVRTPVLNVIDAIWVSHSSLGGYPASATYRANQILASQDPVALDYWAAKYILYPINHDTRHHPTFSGINQWLTGAQDLINGRGGLYDPDHGILIEQVTKNEREMLANTRSLSSNISENIMNLVKKYYQDILHRVPEPGGAEWWTSEIERLASLGIDVKEGFQALARLFFNCEEYRLLRNNDAQFVIDLYQTFLQRSPDPSERNYWVDYLTQGLTRDMLITQFAYSEEFDLYMKGIFGNGTVRPENNLVNDFYRGFLSRLPDTGGYSCWLALMRNAQCGGTQAVRDMTYQIALGFLSSAEYALRSRNNQDYVEDLYNGILRRSADPAGFTDWVTALNTMTREQVLQAFTNSAEFQFKVQEVIDAGCMP